MSDQNEVLAEALKDSGAAMQAISAEKLSRVTTLSKQQQQLEAEYADLEAKLKAKSAELNNVRSVELPKAMTDAGLKDFTLLDGGKVVINKVYRGKIAEGDQHRAFEWMEEHGHSAIINTDVVIRLGKGFRPIARRVLELVAAYLNMLREQGFVEFEVEPLLEESIHWNTLAAWIKEQWELRLDPEQVKELGLPEFPAELFGTTIIDLAKIVPPSKKDK